MTAMNQLGGFISREIAVSSTTDCMWVFLRTTAVFLRLISELLLISQIHHTLVVFADRGSG